METKKNVFREKEHVFRAIFFDFNGVLVDDEPIHLQCFQKALKTEGIELTREHYYQRYLGMDDHDCFQVTARDQGKELSDKKISELTAAKAIEYEKIIAKSPPFVPGAIDFLKEAEKHFYIAIVSGALKHEIQFLLHAAGVESLVNVIVAAEDVEHGKPNPEGYIKAFDALNKNFIPTHQMLLPDECIVFEDSSWGLEAAQNADMHTIALTTSYDSSQLPGALDYIQDFEKRKPRNYLTEISKKITP